jgi:uncharacterized membrane protein (UPF0127 family)
MSFQGSLARLRRRVRPALWLTAWLVWLASSEVPRVVLHTAQGDVSVRVELADTPERRTRGLMHRKELAGDAGMLFVFPRSEVHQFWMKNTPLPLDMIFIAADRTVVGVVEKAEPFTTTGRGVGKPSQYVLEVNGGFSAKYGIRAGDRVDFVGVLPAEN